MSAPMVSANIGSFINAAHHNTISAAAIHTSSVANNSLKITAIETTSHIKPTSINPISTKSINTGVGQNFTSQQHAYQPQTAQATASQTAATDKTQSYKIVGSDPLNSYNLKSGPANLAGVLNNSSVPAQASVTLAEKSVSADVSTNISSDAANTQQSVVRTIAATNDTAADPFAAESDSQSAPQASNNQDETATQQVEQQIVKKQQQIEQAQTKQIEQLVQRDSEVKTHEQAHAAVGGSLTQSPSYQYEKGPDGRRYAVEGEVSIDVSPVSGDPKATLSKMQKVYAAAMAPVQPSMADIRVAAQALQNMNEANKQLIQDRQQDTGSTLNNQTSAESGNIFTRAQNQQPLTPATNSNNSIAPNSSVLKIDTTHGIDNANINSSSSKRPVSAAQGNEALVNNGLANNTVTNNAAINNDSNDERDSNRQIQTSLSSSERDQYQSIEIYV
ncbi:putative metalloprotease CJM1_0395 family protein [Shewanella vesiculosa]|uniref:putative metalloprotease CJM1_0395 family protein n=1 Tax=Shewanella vesiculosa TaxID=518738 RepID=UPI003D066D35